MCRVPSHVWLAEVLEFFADVEMAYPCVCEDIQTECDHCRAVRFREIYNIWRDEEEQKRKDEKRGLYPQYEDPAN